MPRVAIAIMLLCTACTEWRRVPMRDVHDDALLLTDTEAVQLSDARVSDDKIVGHRARAWQVTECTAQPATESPTDIATACRWTEIPSDPDAISIDIASIKSARAKRVAVGRTAFAVTGGVLLGVLVLGIVAISTFAAVRSH